MFPSLDLFYKNIYFKAEQNLLNFEGVEQGWEKPGFFFRKNPAQWVFRVFSGFFGFFRVFSGFFSFFSHTVHKMMFYSNNMFQYL